jgi:hypothetical protein
LIASTISGPALVVNYGDGTQSIRTASSFGVTGYHFEGERFDCGSVQGFVQATVAFALDRADLRDDFATFVRRYRRKSVRGKIETYPKGRVLSKWSDVTPIPQGIQWRSVS